MTEEGRDKAQAQAADARVQDGHHERQLDGFVVVKVLYGRLVWQSNKTTTTEFVFARGAVRAAQNNEAFG